MQKTAECRHLKVKQHMLEVVQRIPKYLCLLKDYSSHLSDQSPDKQDTQGAGSAKNTNCDVFNVIINHCHSTMCATSIARDISMHPKVDKNRAHANT